MGDVVTPRATWRVLGSGTSAGVPMIGCDCDVCRSTVAEDRRSRASGLLRLHDPALTLVVDTGPDFREQALAAGLCRVDGVLYTHTHSDHVHGLDDLRRFNALTGGTIPLYAEARTHAVLGEMFRYIFEPHRNLNRSFIPQLDRETVEPGRPLDLPGVRVTPVRVMHGNEPILGFRFDVDGGGSLAYCTDCSELPAASMALLQGLDVLIVDGLRLKPHPTHFNLAQAAGVVAELRPRRAFVTHLAHDLSHADYAAELARLSPEVPLAPAFDGLEIGF